MCAAPEAFEWVAQIGNKFANLRNNPMISPSDVVGTIRAGHKKVVRPCSANGVHFLSEHIQQDCETRKMDIRLCNRGTYCPAYTLSNEIIIEKHVDFYCRDISTAVFDTVLRLALLCSKIVQQLIEFVCKNPSSE